MATPTALKKILPGFRCIVDDGPCDSSGVVITDDERVRTAQYMKERGLKAIPDGGCTVVPVSVARLRRALEDLSAQHSQRLRQAGLV